MRKFLFIFFWMSLVLPLMAQVDVDRRRVLMFQTGFPVLRGEEKLGGVGMFWFNENHFPVTNTAVRVVYMGVYADAELSHFVTGISTNTAVGIGGGGGVHIDDMAPYVRGQRLSGQEFYGDGANARIFINQTIPIPSRLPLNLRGAYVVSRSSYRKAPRTENFTLPSDFLMHSVSGELRLGGIEPDLIAKRGLELYILADQNWRDGFKSFGPNNAPFQKFESYQRLYGSLSAKLPLKPYTVGFRLAGGTGNDLDELSAWKLGGHLINFDSFSQTLHGYYTREIITDDYMLVNLSLSHPLYKPWNVEGHLYADYAGADGVRPLDTDWHNYFGLGAGVSFTTVWDMNILVNYGYGFNAVRGDGKHGGHEMGLGLEKKF